MMQIRYDSFGVSLTRKHSNKADTKIQNVIMIVTDHAQLDCVIDFNGQVFSRGRGKLQTRESDLERA